MKFETILYEKRDRIAKITLNRPHRLNAFDSVMRAELPRAWRDIREDPDVWVVIVTAAGDRAFCTGVDVREAADAGGVGNFDSSEEWGAGVHRECLSIVDECLPAPTRKYGGRRRRPLRYAAENKFM